MLLLWPSALGELAEALEQLVFPVNLTEFRIPWESDWVHRGGKTSPLWAVPFSGWNPGESCSSVYSCSPFVLIHM